MDFFIQFIGILGAFCAFLAYQCNNHKKIMIFKTLCEFSFALQFALLGAFTGCAMNSVGCVRNLLFAYLVSKNKNTLPWVIVFSAIGITLGCLTWAGPLSIIAVSAKTLTTVAYGFKNAQTVRFLAFPSSVAWLIYDSIYFSIGGIICESFALVSMIIATVLYYKRKTHKA